MGDEITQPFELAGACLGLAPYTYFTYPTLLAAEGVVIATCFLLNRVTPRSKLIYSCYAVVDEVSRMRSGGETWTINSLTCIRTIF